MAQFKRIWLPYEPKDKYVRSKGLVFESRIPIDAKETAKADTEIQNLITCNAPKL